MDGRRTSWVKVHRRSLRPTKIVAGGPITNPTPVQKVSFVSDIYGQLVATIETEKLCKRLGMTQDDVRQLRRIFDEEDDSNSDSVTIRGFFRLINDDAAFERSHVLTKELLRIAHITSSADLMTFDQYLRIVCTFASFSETQLWRFFYNALFAEGANTVNARRLVEVLQAAGGSYAHNIQVAARHFANNAALPLQGASSSLTFKEFEEIVRRNPVVFFPVILMQRSVRCRSLGEKFWEKKVQEQLVVTSLMEHLRLHDGILPQMKLRERVMNALLDGNTVTARARTLARQEYIDEVRTKM